MRRSRGRRIAAAAAVYTALVAATAVFLTPVWLMVATSLTPAEGILSGGAGPGSLWPEEPTAAHYRAVVSELAFGRFLLNSTIIVGSIVAGGLVVNALLGYALSRLRWRGRRLVMTGVLAILVVPYEAIAVPLFFEMVVLGWTDSYHVQILPFLANPFAVYLFATFFGELPRELDDAARVDGAGPLRIFTSVIVPLSRPAFAAVAVLTFLFHWGFLLWPLMVTHGPRYQPLPVALGYFSATRPVPWGEVMAFGTLLVLPVLFVFLVFQRWLVRGITTAGLKL